MDLLSRVSLKTCVSAGACLAVLLLATGCDRGPQTVPVEGKVLIDGEPLTQGLIRFVAGSGRPSSGKIAEDGSFRVVSLSGGDDGRKITGLVPGSYRISVKASEMLGEDENAEVKWLVPRHYSDARTSGLKADITEPTEDLTIELTWEGSEEEKQEQEE